MNFQNYDRHSLDLYLKEIFSHKTLTPQEEVQLFTEYDATKSPKLFQKIIESNLRFVYQISREYLDWKALSLNDLIEEGNLGLIESIRTFDVTKGFRFITHAVHWIRRFIINAICENKSNVRLPWNIHNESHKLSKTWNKHEAEFGVVDIEAVSKEICLTPKEITSINKYTAHNVRFDAPTSNEDGASTVIETHMPKNIDKDTYESEHKKLVLDSIFHQMSKREVEILKDVYGIDREYPMSKEDVASKNNLSVVRINQLIDESCIVMKIIAKKKFNIQSV